MKYFSINNMRSGTDRQISHIWVCISSFYYHSDCTEHSVREGLLFSIKRWWFSQVKLFGPAKWMCIKSHAIKLNVWYDTQRLLQHCWKIWQMEYGENMISETHKSDWPKIKAGWCWISLLHLTQHFWPSICRKVAMSVLTTLFSKILKFPRSQVRGTRI